MSKIFKGDLISAGTNAKTVKGDKLGVYATAIMYLAPADSVPGVNLCPFADIAKCKAGCLNTAGRGRFSNVQAARIRKTKLYRDNRARFMATLVRDVERFVEWCDRNGVKPAVRLNGTSDIQFERGHMVYHNGHTYNSIFDAFPDVQFFDYTKIYKRVYRPLPVNYALTLSYSEANPEYSDAIINAAHDTGANVAVVWRSKQRRDQLVNTLVRWHKGQKVCSLRVIDGDETDLRFTDPAGAIVGLYAKGDARRDQSGFVLD